MGAHKRENSDSCRAIVLLRMMMRRKMRSKTEPLVVLGRSQYRRAHRWISAPLKSIWKIRIERRGWVCLFQANLLFTMPRQ
jgi:hypothetical protein